MNTQTKLILKSMIITPKYDEYGNAYYQGLTNDQYEQAYKDLDKGKSYE